MARFLGTYRIESARLPEWDYSSSGWYFITICTKDHVPFLGEVVDGKMNLSHIGKIVAETWPRVVNIHPGISLDAWVVMPNHFHAIVILQEETAGNKGRSQSNRNWRPGSLGVIVNWFKSSCTKRIRKTGLKKFAWQSRYYDHVIRNDDDLRRIQEYILNNPERWEQDHLHPPRYSR